VPHQPPDVPRHQDGAPERRLAVLLAGTEATRRARADEAAALLRAADSARLLELLERLHVTVLLGERLRELVGDVGPALEEAITAAAAWARDHGRIHELATLSVLAGLERDGIRALALKGSVLARELYGDVGARSSGDIDILVATDELEAAIASAERIGWRWQPQTARAAPLPVLHETLTHPRLPRIELHWRVHWYETRFAADALGRAKRVGPHQPLIMSPADGLAALTLFYERDGFSGLRLAADVAAWWDARCAARDADTLIASVADAYPELAAPLWVGIQLLGPLVGLPTHADRARLSWRVAAQLAGPFCSAPGVQANATASLVDLLLAPRGSRADAVRRETRKIPEQLERPLTRHDDLSDHLARWDHVMRVSRRWMLTLPAALLRAARTPSIAEGIARRGKG
jgi:hypothetical protein